MEELLEKLLGKWLAKPLAKLARWIEKQNAEADAAREAEQSAHGEGVSATAQADDGQASPPPASPASSAYPLGIASCWHGANAAERMMNVLSPSMSDAKFGTYLAWMLGKGCTAAHVILANGSDGECAGYAGWHDSDLPVMLLRVQRLRDAGLEVVPWIITDDSADLLRELLKGPEKCVGKMSGLLKGAPYVVLGLEMDEVGTASQWKAVRDAVRKYYSGPLGVHHTSGNSFPMASLGDIILGQLNPGCSEAQVKAQIKSILAKGKRAVGFEYSRGPNRKLSLAALEAGAEGCGNWDGGDLPTTAAAPAAPAQSSQSSPEDGVDFSQLEWAYGGFKGGGAKLDGKARIFNLQVKADGMTYKWLSGGCENLGASSSTDASCLACLFVLLAGKWRGGKFDWISTSRTSRDFKNIKESYNGWPSNSISAAGKFAFVIVSKDGKRRTNTIVCGR